MPTYLSPGVYVEEVPSAVKPIAGVSTSTAGFVGVIPDTVSVPQSDPTAPGDPNAKPPVPKGVKLSSASVAAAKSPKLVTNWSEFTKAFGDFSTDPGQNALAQGVYGFFNNGGNRGYVMRFPSLTDLEAPSALAPFEAIDEISIVAAPGISDASVYSNLLNHCSNLKSRFAILDSAGTITGDLTPANIKPPGDNSYGAFYFPWIKVFDPASKLMQTTPDGQIFVGPSGHLAGIYARVDNDRGVHKAPANEPVLGALDVAYPISKSLQNGLNPTGINCIRNLSGNIRVWGARTIGGDDNMEWKYVNVRRLFIFLRESIDRGTQWVVFEPNDQALWAKVTRGVTAFLTNVWRDGALFGSAPQEAFYVKCDAETNPPSVRDLGQLVIEVGVAVVKPAEFVIFRISQWAGPGK